MNRLITKTPPPAASITQRRVPAPAQIVPDQQPGVVLFAPLHYEPNYAYPLVVWLHVEGKDENDLTRMIPQISMRNYVAVAPRGTLSLPASNMNDAAQAFGWSQSAGHIELARRRVLAAIQQAGQYRIHPRRIFLVGQGCGGSMALRLAMTMPEVVRGVASLDGPFPSGDTPLRRLAELRDLEIMLAASRSGGRYPSSSVCRDLRLLHVAGMNTTLRQYPDNETLDRQIPGDVDRWIMEVLSREPQASVVVP
ncbi:MAG: alpha/beta hydrolase-fold protein [Planctomycetota bacterium]|nr:alpha/beta hydrolase-fold protein [Planctomycetota bacterium]